MDDARTYAPRVHSQNSQLCRVHIKPQNRNDFEAVILSICTVMYADTYYFRTAPLVLA
jgi:hypothetical protein